MIRNIRHDKSFWSTAAFICVLCITLTATAQQTPGTSIYLSKDLTARVEKGRERLTLSLIAPNEPTRSVTLPDEIDAVDTVAQVYGSKIAVIGEVSSSGKEVVIMDSNNQEQVKPVDTFLCYQPTISPNGEYVAFTRFFPGHFVTAQQASNCAMLYDVQGAAVSNQINAPEDEDNDLGQLLYPKDSHCRGEQAEARKGHRTTHFFMFDHYFWSQDSSKVLFLDEQYPMSDSRAGLLFVLVDVSSKPPRVSVLASDICATESGNSCLVRLNGVHFDESGITAELQGFGVKAAFHKVVRLTPAQFVPTE